MKNKLNNMNEDSFEKYIRNEASYLTLSEEDFKIIYSNRKMLIILLKMYGNNLQKLTDKQKDDQELVEAAMSSYKATFEYASNRLKADKDFVKKIVLNKGSLIKYASDDIKDDFECAKIALEKSPFAYPHLSARLRDDEELLFMTAKHSGYFLKNASERLKGDFEIIKKLCEFNFYFVLSLKYENLTVEMIDYILNHPKWLVFRDKINEESLDTQNSVEDFILLVEKMKRENALKEQLILKDEDISVKKKI